MVGGNEAFGNLDHVHLMIDVSVLYCPASVHVASVPLIGRDLARIIAFPDNILRDYNVGGIGLIYRFYLPTVCQIAVDDLIAVTKLDGIWQIQSIIAYSYDFLI